jgi:hypothetical protein
VLKQCLIDFGQPLQNRGVSGDVFAQAHKRPDNENAHERGATAPQHIRRHQNTVLGKHARAFTRPSARTGHSL